MSQNLSEDVATQGPRTEQLRAKRWVVKLGSSLVTNQGRGVDTEAIKAFAGLSLIHI